MNSIETPNHVIQRIPKAAAIFDYERISVAVYARTRQRR
jgi:hypothetical protein